MTIPNSPAGGVTSLTPAVRAAGWLGFSLVVVVVLVLAFPVYVPLKYRVPGFQAVTPNKILLPLLVPIAAALALSGDARRRWWNPVTGAFGIFVAWHLASAAFNATGNLVLNFKNLIWLVLAFLLHLVMVATVITPGRRKAVVVATATLAAVLSVLGFVEIYTFNAWDQFFMLFRPQLIDGDVVGNGPSILLPLHNYYAGRRILQSTLGSFTVFALLSAFLYGQVVEMIGRPGWRRRADAWLLLLSFWLMAGATWFTFSRAAVLQVVTGIGAGLALAFWLRRRVPWAAIVAALAVSVVVTVADPESVGRVTEKFGSTRYGVAELRRVDSTPSGGVASAGRPAAAQASPAPDSRAARETADQESPPPAPAGSFSVAQRMILARVAVDMAIRYPVFGAGPLNFRPLLYGDPHYQSMFRLDVLEVFDAHSFYLTTLATVGPIGLLLLLGLMWLALRRLAAGFGPGGPAGGALALSCAWASFLVGGFFGFSLLDPVSDIVFAMLLGGVVIVCPDGAGASRESRDERAVRVG